MKLLPERRRLARRRLAQAVAVAMAVAVVAPAAVVGFSLVAAARGVTPPAQLPDRLGSLFVFRIDQAAYRWPRHVQRPS